MEEKIDIQENPVVYDKYLTLFLDEEFYGIDISYVSEIIAVMKTTKIPKTPSFLEGVMNLRGNIIPVVNVRKKFEMQEKERDDRTAIVIVKIDSSDIGLIVDGVEEVISVDSTLYSEPPKFNTAIDSELLSKMARVDNRVIMMLDLSKFFNSGELDFLTNIGDDEEG